MRKSFVALEHVSSPIAIAKLEEIKSRLEEKASYSDQSTYLGTPEDAAAPAGKGGGQGQGGPKNKAPVANNDTLAVAINGTKIINVLSNDADPNGDPLIVTSTTSALHGTVLFNANGSVTYTAVAGYEGFDSFQYSISDGRGGTSTATVNVTVGAPNRNPDAVNDSTVTTQNKAVTINILQNDTDPDGNTLSVSTLGAAKNGTVVLNADGTVTYTPNSGYMGNDSFTYTISDGKGGTDTAIVNVGVQQPPPPYYIQALDSGIHYPTSGQTITVTYGFPITMPTYLVGTKYATAWQIFNTQQQDAVRQILAKIETMVNIDFVEVSSGGQMLFQNFSEGASGYVGYAAYPSSTSYGRWGDVFINAYYSAYTKPAEGNDAYNVLMHEIGHSLGLDHPHDNITLPSGEDSTKYTVMSYNRVSGSPETPMIYDIAALQYFYGANTTYNTGNNTYMIDWSARYAIWDAGGIDTLDGSLQSGAMTLNLQDGSFSSAGRTGNVSIAFGAMIENASGGSGNDTINGNALNNVLKGNGGADTLKGNLGVDTLYGGNGDDTLHFDGQDVLYGDAGIDTVVALFNAIIDTGSTLLNSIEKFNFFDTFSNIINIDLADILNLSDNDDLIVLADGSDVLNVTGGSNLGQIDIGGTLFNHYSNGVADLFVTTGVNINETIV